MADIQLAPPLDDWAESLDIATSADVEIPERMVDQVIGQEEAVAVIRKATEQRRHVLLIGDPGTGKSMLAKSMVEFLPKGLNEDVIAYPNPEDPNEPKIRVVPAGKGKEIVQAQKIEALKRRQQKTTLLLFLVLGIVAISVVFALSTGGFQYIFWGIIAAVIVFVILRQVNNRTEQNQIPKLLVGHDPDDMPEFIDATGAHSGALLGDVKHDPFQSGGLETPAHERVEVGAIHKANLGVLYLDEINMLRIESQHALLTALQEGAFPISGQSERSSGAMVKSQPVPCDFILVAAGNVDAMQGMHPALRSRIRGYGYEIYMQRTMPDTVANRMRLIRFIAQEVVNDKKIPHFNRGACIELIRDAQRRSGSQGKLTVRLRELGGLVRAAGDIATEDGSSLVTRKHFAEARHLARSLEQQIVDEMLIHKKEYQSYNTTGAKVGTVNGLWVMGGAAGVSQPAGGVLPIVAEVTPAHIRNEGRIIATGKLGEIAKESVHNVAALIKKHTGEDIANHDIHIQFIGTYDGVDGDSASITIATAVISSLEDVPVDQTLAMTGSVSVRGDVLPIGGVTQKIEAAAKTGLKKVIIPAANLKDVLIDLKYREMIEIIPVKRLEEVLEIAFLWDAKDHPKPKAPTATPKPTPPIGPRPTIA